jgi:sterol desaturase/sphingolipid hydroxylase (fatty acid hydroxylase superfamily)
MTPSSSPHPGALPRCLTFGMGSVKRVAWALCFMLACCLLVMTGSEQLRQLANAHRDATFFLLLSVLLTIPTGIVTLASGYLIEALLVGWSRSSLRSLQAAPASARLDLLSMAMSVLPHRRLGSVLSFGLLYVVDAHLLRSTHLSVTRFLPTWGIQVACVLVSQSFVMYWVHRMEHAIPALWALHKFHHSASQMTILTAVRQTELMKGVEQLLPLVFLALLTEPVAAQPGAGSPLFALFVAYFAYRCFIRVNQYLCHSALTTGYGWIGRWLLVSPRMHRLHHAVAPQFHDRNFTFDLVIWDRLFGTYASCEEADLATLPLGLEHGPFNHDATIKGVLRDYFVTTYVVFWQSLRSGVKAWRPGRRSSHTAQCTRAQLSPVETATHPDPARR